MARVVALTTRAGTAIYRHDCGAIVEFTREDVFLDARDESYVLCPACRKVPWIAARLLSFVLSFARSPCERWSGPGGDCAICGVAAYSHPGAPTPASRGCEEFVDPGAVGVGLGDAWRCGYCSLPIRDHEKKETM